MFKVKRSDLKLVLKRLSQLLIFTTESKESYKTVKNWSKNSDKKIKRIPEFSYYIRMNLYLFVEII